MKRGVIVGVLAVVLTGTTGGYALGGFVTGAEPRAASENWWSIDAAAEDKADAPPVMAAAVKGPEGYRCHGCGPTLAERRAQADLAMIDPGYREEPMYEPVAAAVEAPTPAPELPVLPERQVVTAAVGY